MPKESGQWPLNLKNTLIPCSDSGDGMKDYTEIFSKAIELKNSYDFKAVMGSINANNDLQCGDWDDWADAHDQTQIREECRSERHKLY